MSARRGAGFTGAPFHGYDAGGSQPRRGRMIRKTRRDAHGPSPQQQRSRDSHERVVRATEKLLRSKVGAEFTLADVSRESGVSVGGIYGRFHNREAIIRAVQVRTNERMDEEYSATLAEIRSRDADGVTRIRELTAAIASLMQRHGPTIRAIVQASFSDPVVAAEGRRIYAKHLAEFKAAILEHREVVTHEDAEQALEFCYLSTYEVIATHLGVARSVSAESHDWARLVDYLQHQNVAFLTTPRSRGTGGRAAPAKPIRPRSAPASGQSRRRATRGDVDT